MPAAKKTTKKTKAAKTTARKPVRKAAPRRVAKPAAPKKWSDDIHDVNVVWYNVKDLMGAKRFYGETLGLPLAFGNEEMGWFEFGYPNQAHLAINWWRGPDPMPPVAGGATVTFTTHDARGAIERLRAKGIRVDTIDEVPGMVILGSFYDPEGNRLQVAQNLMPVG